MNRLTSIALALASVAALLWAVLFGTGHERRGIQHPPAGATADRPAPKDALPVASVLDVRPGVADRARASPVRSPARASPAPSANLAQFRARIDYASLYRNLADDRSPEARYLEAQIYARCARHDDKSAREAAVEAADKRAQFIASLAQAGPGAPSRVAAFDRLRSDPCAGLDLGAFDKARYAQMVVAASDGGDVRAQALRLAERVQHPYDASGGRVRYAMSEADFEQARELLASGDPDVIRHLQDVLSSTLDTGGIRLDGSPIDSYAMHSALELLACDAGAPCGADTPRLLMNCAYRGQCYANSVYESAYYYENAPAQSQLVDAYRRSLQMMLNDRNFSGLTFSPGDATPGYSVTFGSGGPGM